MLGASEIRGILEEHGLDPRRSLGQNFVADPNTVRRIVRLAGVAPGDRVVEIGPGIGSLTLALLDAGAEVLAVEKDGALVPVLRDVLERAGSSRPVQVLHADALGVDWADLLSDDRWVLVANLPYNVAVPMVIEILERAPMIERLVVMVQREVADRLVASPGGRVIGIPSMKVSWYGAARMLATVSPEVFIPKPRVASAIVRHRPPAAPEHDRGTRRRLRAGRHRLPTAAQDAALHARRGVAGRRLRSGRSGPDGTAGAAVRRGVGATGRGLDRSAILAVTVVLRANAKLTLSLRVTGVRPDGYHLIDSEMVTLDLHDDLVLSDER